MFENTEPKRLRPFAAEYFGATSTEPKTVRITDLRRKAHIVITASDEIWNGHQLHGLSSAANSIAAHYLNWRGINVDALGLLGDQVLLMTEDFELNILPDNSRAKTWGRGEVGGKILRMVDGTYRKADFNGMGLNFR